MAIQGWHGPWVLMLKIYLWHDARLSSQIIQVAVEQMWAIQAFKYAETHFKVSLYP